MNSKRMLLRLLRLGLLSLFFVHQTTPALSIIEESVKELIVERRVGFFDSFTVKMKTDRTCDSATCTSLGALFVFLSSSSCSCQCGNYQPFTFLSSIQRCANTTQVHDFGGCDEYLNLRPILSYDTNPRQQPVDLITASSLSLSATQATSCTFNQKYSVHDYSGFQSRWRTISNMFFNLRMTSGNGKFNLNWKADSNGTLSGKIIRIPITCSNAQGSSSTPCFLLKAKGTVTYYAPPTPTVLSSSSSVISPPPPPIQTSYLASSLLSSSSGQSSLPSHLPQLSSPILFTSSALSPSPSLIVILSTITSGVSHSVSSYLPSAQIPTAKLSTPRTLPTEIPFQSTTVEAKPSKAIITSVSSSSAISNGPAGDKGTKTSGNDNGIVIGSAVGGGVVLGILVVLSVVICWKRRKPGNVAARYNSAEVNYANCPVYQTLNEKNPGTPVYQLPVYQSNGQPTNSSNEIQLETPKARTSPMAQEDQPTYQDLLNVNRQSNLAATYNRAEGSYENCPVYHTLNKKNPGTPVYQSPVHQSTGLSEGASTGINEEQDGHGTQYEPLRRP
ncbi:unnamed protein product [Porites lobata]|uniref:Uncharacterized protein n=1 Tax=Porites lobata TaxID=104759 RepID=A0ABN8P937_9CNID|nr:unnamed protein product [Porites lobata]